MCTHKHTQTRTQAHTHTHTNTTAKYMKYTVEPVYYGHLGTNQKYPDYQGVLIFQVNLHDKAQFGTKCVDYAGVLIFKCPD